MANIIKIPCAQNQNALPQNTLPFSDINHIKTYCTPHNFTYSMNSDHEWGEYTPHTPSWATTNYWMNENLVPDSASPSWTLTDNGTTVQLRWNKYTANGRGNITHNDSTGIEEFTCYIVGKNLGTGGDNYQLLWTTADTYGPGDAPPPDTYHYITLFNHYQNQIGISYPTGSKWISPDTNRNYHIFAFKWRYVFGGCPCTLNVDGTSDSFEIPGYSRIHGTYFPAYANTASIASNWDIKLIAFLNVAEPDDVISNNVNILRMIYQ